MKLRFSCMPCSLLVPLLAAGCSHAPVQPDVASQEIHQPDRPAGYRTIAPMPGETSDQMLAQTASVFTGSLKNVYFTYDDCDGPRTNYVFDSASSLLGAPTQSEVTVKVLGGPTPEGRWLSVSELSNLSLGSTYVIFLRSSDWTYSPILGDLVFRQERIGQRDVLIDPQGRAVIGWGETGPLLSTQVASAMVGQQRGGYRTMAKPDTHATLPTAALEMVAEVRRNPQPSSQLSRDASGPAGLLDYPSASEIRASGLFARPALLPQAIAHEKTLTSRAFVEEVRGAAQRAGIRLGGRIALDPYWNCWDTTPTRSSVDRHTQVRRVAR